MREFSPQKIPLPPDFQALPLDPARPIDVEIGCGVGFHPIRYALANPTRQLVAIERTLEKYEKFARRLSRHEPLPNLFPIHGDAIAWISHAFRPASVDQFLILYPNPYPKMGQRNLRFHNMPFFSQLKKSLKPGGEILLATNMEFYAQEAASVVARVWDMEILDHSLVPQDASPRTHFEKKYLARGEPCWNLRFGLPRGIK